MTAKCWDHLRLHGTHQQMKKVSFLLTLSLGWVILPAVLDSTTLDVLNSYTNLLLRAEQWNSSSYTYMGGPGGTRGVGTKAGWLKLYAGVVQSLIHVHPEVFAVACELYGTPKLSFNYYEMKLQFPQPTERDCAASASTRSRHHEFEHSDINMEKARLLHLCDHHFETFYQMVLPFRQQIAGALDLADSTHSPDIWMEPMTAALTEGRWQYSGWQVSNLHTVVCLSFHPFSITNLLLKIWLCTICNRWRM